MGLNQTDFPSIVQDIVAPMATILPKKTNQTMSKNKKYISITLTIIATSTEQLEHIHNTLKNHPKILMFL